MLALYVIGACMSGTMCVSMDVWSYVVVYVCFYICYDVNLIVVILLTIHVLGYCVCMYVIVYAGYLCMYVCMCVCMHTSTVQTFNSCTSRPDVRQYLFVQTPKITCQRSKPSSSMNHLACKSKLRLVVRSSMHQCPRNRMPIGRAVVYDIRAAQAF